MTFRYLLAAFSSVVLSHGTGTQAALQSVHLQMQCVVLCIAVQGHQTTVLLY